MPILYFFEVKVSVNFRKSKIKNLRQFSEPNLWFAKKSHSFLSPKFLNKQKTASFHSDYPFFPVVIDTKKRGSTNKPKPALFLRQIQLFLITEVKCFLFVIWYCGLVFGGQILVCYFSHVIFSSITRKTVALLADLNPHREWGLFGFTSSLVLL